MKWIAFALAAGLALAAFGLWPFEPQEPGNLLPVRTLCAAADGEAVEIRTDNGLYGRGRTYGEAMDALEKSAPGTAFFASCSEVILCPAKQLLAAAAADDRLRPAVSLYDCDSVPDPAGVQGILDAHRGGVTLSDVRRGEAELPRLEEQNGGWFVDAVS